MRGEESVIAWHLTPSVTKLGHRGRICCHGLSGARAGWPNHTLHPKAESIYTTPLSATLFARARGGGCSCRLPRLAREFVPDASAPPANTRCQPRRSSARLDWRFAASSVGKEPLPGRHTPHPHARRSRRWRPLACSPRRAAVPQRALPCLSPIVWRAHAAGALAQNRGPCSTSLCFYIFARLLYFYCRLSTDSQQLWCRSPVRF